VDPIRYGRLRKFRNKNKFLFLFIKFLAVWYLFIGISTILSGQTNAYFSDQDRVNGIIQAGEWETESSCAENGKHGDWDCSSLKFIGSKFDGEKISATIENTGEDMKSGGKYEIYYSEKGNPKQGERLVRTLTFKALKNGEKLELTFTPELNGVYMFKAYQHEDHPGGGELWSGEINVKLAEVVQPDSGQESEVKEKQQGEKEAQSDHANHPDQESDDNAAKKEEPASVEAEEKPKEETAEVKGISNEDAKKEEGAQAQSNTAVKDAAENPGEGN